MSFDSKHNIVRLTLEGRVADAILLDAYATIASYVASRPTCRGIIDFSKVTEFEVSSSAVRRLASSPPAMPGCMRVFVAPQDFIFGMVRMFQLLGEEARPDLLSVRTMDEAYRLLQVESPEFGPVS